MGVVSGELEKYLKKLIKTIETQASFSFGNKKIVNKTRIDDILCCIDVNFPEILKRFLKEYGTDKNVRCFKIYEKLIANIKIKPLLGNDSYAVNYNEVSALIPQLKESIETDVNYVQRTYAGLQDN